MGFLGLSFPYSCPLLPAIADLTVEVSAQLRTVRVSRDSRVNFSPLDQRSMLSWPVGSWDDGSVSTLRVWVLLRGCQRILSPHPPCHGLRISHWQAPDFSSHELSRSCSSRAGSCSTQPFHPRTREQEVSFIPRFWWERGWVYIREYERGLLYRDTVSQPELVVHKYWDGMGWDEVEQWHTLCISSCGPGDPPVDT